MTSIMLKAAGDNGWLTTEGKSNPKTCNTSKSKGRGKKRCEPIASSRYTVGSVGDTSISRQQNSSLSISKSWPKPDDSKTKKQTSLLKFLSNESTKRLKAGDTLTPRYEEEMGEVVEVVPLKINYLRKKRKRAPEGKVIISKCLFIFLETLMG